MTQHKKVATKRLATSLRRDLNDPEFRALLFFAVLIVAIGVVFYMFAEGWDLLESFYFSVTTLTTVGFGDLHPTNDLSRLFTAFYALIGIGFMLGLLAIMARLASARITNRVRPGRKQSHKKK